jgi:farnesyl-diphosphate farnesyltransferase
MYFAARRAKVLPKDPALAFCYDMLNRVSRSFAIVIQQLPVGLRDAICVFYLVLRALDTVEDDMALSNKVKIPLLRSFHEKCYQRGWSMECGTGHYIDLMKNYPLVIDVFVGLEREYQLVIADITKKMGNGMADFIPKEVKTVEEYNLYCHYVAGLVGIGLSQLFASSGLEGKEFLKMKDRESLANEMGLFLQKTNIIRDYLEDINEEPAPRMFWPKEIWGKYGKKLADFKDEMHAEAAVRALNAMIVNALSHAENCLLYMSKLRNPYIFGFCAIPQIMAIATLALCYNNHAIFTGVVKMRRGEVAKLIFHLRDFGDVCYLFRKYASEISAKAQAQAASDPNLETIVDQCDSLIQACNQWLKMAEKDTVDRVNTAAKVPLSGRIIMLIGSTMYAAYAWQVEGVRAYFGIPERSYSTGIDHVNRILAALLLAYAFAVAILGRRLAHSVSD